MSHATPRLFDADLYTVPERTVNEIRDRYLLPYRNNTRSAYGSDLRMWFRWCADRGIPILDAQRFHIELYDQENEGSGLRASTRQRKLTAVCGYYRYAEEERYIHESPGRYVRKPKVPQVSMSNWLERFEVSVFLAAADELGPNHSALCCLLVLNGLRVGEAVGIDIDDLSFSSGHRTATILRKGGKTAEVPLAPRTFRSILKAVGERPDGPLVLDATGKRMTRHTAGKAVRRAASRAGITRRIGPHALRHTYITMALDASVPLRDVQHDAGHAHPSTTTRYDHGGRNLDRNSTYVVSAFVGVA